MNNGKVIWPNGYKSKWAKVYNKDIVKAAADWRVICGRLARFDMPESSVLKVAEHIKFSDKFDVKKGLIWFRVKKRMLQENAKWN